MKTVSSRALIYARVSTSQQDYERQVTDLTRDAERMGWVVLETIGGYVSGLANDSDLNRVREKAARHQFDVLMVWELSRLTRKGPGAILGLVQQFEAWGIRVWSHQETWLNMEGPARELLIALFGWFAKLERQMISERTKSALARRRALGVRLGRPPGSKDRKPRGTPNRQKRPIVFQAPQPSVDEGGPLY